MKTLFQKRHYEALVQMPCLTMQRDHPVTDLVRVAIVKELADRFMADNPRFDKARFLAACNVNIVAVPADKLDEATPGPMVP